MSRICTFAALVLAAATLAAGARGAGEMSQAVAGRRALEVYELMQRYFYEPATRSYAGTYPPTGNGHAQVWPLSQAIAATLEIARLPRLGRAARAELPGLIASLAPYRAALAGELAYAPLYGGHGNVFYDDNVWVGMELLDAASLLRDRAELAAAERVFALLESGWDTQAAVCQGGIYWLVPGGVYWDRSPASRYRTAVSTANAALLGTELFEATGRRADLRFAERAYAWSQRCLGTPAGLVADHIDAAGRVTTTIHSYNQGAMVAAAVNLYRLTHERRYLSQALHTASASLARFRYALGRNEPAAFLAIF